jgi:hypothetical protein
MLTFSSVKQVLEELGNMVIRAGRRRRTGAFRCC